MTQAQTQNTSNDISKTQLDKPLNLARSITRNPNPPKEVVELCRLYLQYNPMGLFVRLYDMVSDKFQITRKFLDNVTVYTKQLDYRHYKNLEHESYTVEASAVLPSGLVVSITYTVLISGGKVKTSIDYSIARIQGDRE